MKKRVEKDISILIPSKIIDDNLKFCLKKIRKFYKNIKLILVLDEPSEFKIDKNIQIVISGNKTIGFKRNLGLKYVTTKFVSFIDSDAYPNSRWLDESLKLFKNKKIALVGGPNLSPKTKNIEKILVARSRRNSIVTLNPKVKSIKTKQHFINFLPSCNMIMRTSIYKKIKGMDPRLYSSEEISLNYKLNKKGFKMIFDPKVFVFHSDRNFKHFSRQRFIYGSTGLWYLIRYPCKESFMLFASSFPTLFVLSFPMVFISNALKLTFLLGIFFLILSILINSVKINFKNNFIKSLKLSLISFFYPGVGLLARIFLTNNTFKKLYTQK